MFHIGVSVRNGLAPLLAVLIALAMPAAAQVVNYADFTSVSGLTLNGNASQVSPALRLTPTLQWQRGSAFLSSPIVLRGDASFCTQFAFRMPDPVGTESSNTDPGADGIVFAIQKDGNTALGANGGYLGYFRHLSVGTITTGVGVEFDSWYNGGTFGDYDGNHVAINTNGTMPSLASTPFGPKLNDGTTYHAWVDYNGVAGRLEVYLSDLATRPSAPIHTQMIDLASSLGGGANVFPGFTSATGLAYNTHELLSWRLSAESCVPVDLKPGSNPNCVNPRSNGVVSVAISKTDLFDPSTLIQDSITFGGASALGCSTEDADADGDLDLTCRFNTQDISWPAAGSNCGIVALTADTIDGTTVTSYAVACLAGEASCNAGTAVGSEYIAVP